MDFEALEKRFGIEFSKHFSEEVKFVTENGLMKIKYKDKTSLLTSEADKSKDTISNLDTITISETNKT